MADDRSYDANELICIYELPQLLLITSEVLGDTCQIQLAGRQAELRLPMHTPGCQRPVQIPRGRPATKLRTVTGGGVDPSGKGDDLIEAGPVAVAGIYGDLR